MAADLSRALNINVGVMGHVDSGKTSLVRALSQVLSTAALDKHPQSRQRGITMDLGFSAFALPAPEHLKKRLPHVEAVQYTLVDCPGHASLIRTIIGGSQIIDMVLLVIDVTKGIQTQTAECLVIAEVTTENLIVVLNKVDMLESLAGSKKASKKGATAGAEPAADAAALLAKATGRIRKALESTRFADAPMVAISAAPGGAGKSGAGGSGSKADGAAAADLAQAAAERADVSALLGELQLRAPVPNRSPGGALFMSVDHGFQVKGHGTVLTGTVLRGSLSVGDEVEVPEMGERRKVKSIQMFRRDVRSIAQGDRAGFAVSSLAGGKLERAVVCSPGTVSAVRVAVALVRRIRYFKGDVTTAKTRVHLTVGHSTVMAQAVFFGAQELAEAGVGLATAVRSDEGDAAGPATGAGAAAAAAAAAAAPTSAGGDGARASGAQLTPTGLRPPALPFDWDTPYVWQDSLVGKVRVPGAGAGADSRSVKEPWQWALLLLDAPIYCPPDSTVIGSRLDADESAPTCRLAFAGQLREVVAPADMLARATARGHPASATAPLTSADASAAAAAMAASAKRCLRVYRPKERTGQVERVASGEAAAGGACEVVCKGLFSKGSDVTRFLGLEVGTPSGARGTLAGAFGKSGKVRVRLSGAPVAVGDPVTIAIRKYVFDPDKRTVQQG